MNNKSYNKLFFIVFLVFMLLAIISAYVGVLLIKEYNGVIFGSVLMLITIPFAVNFKKVKKVQIFISVLNAIFTGLSISTFFVVKGYDSLTALLNLIYSGLISVVVYLMLVGYKKINILNNHKYIKLFLNLSLFLGLIAFYIYGYIALNEPLFFSLSCLSVIAYGIYVVSLKKIKSKKQLFNNVCLSSYCIYIAVAIVVLIFLSEGEAAELGEMFAGDIDTNSKTKNKKNSLAAGTIVANEVINDNKEKEQEEENEQKSE